MKIILTNAFLDNAKTLIKTKDNDLYGIHNIIENKEIIPPRYLHIYEFDGETAVAINKNEKYVQINKLGKESTLPVRKVGEYQLYLVKGDRCNCSGDGCSLCGGTGVLFNAYGSKNNFRYLRDFDAFSLD